MKILRILSAIVIIIFIAWISRGWFTSSVEKPASIVTKKYDGFEIREVPSQITATVSVSAQNESDASSKGFQALAGYIFGDNTRQDSIAMTAPVTSKKISQKIAMTAPVTANASNDGTYEVSFIMPSERAMDTLPVPNNTAVKLSQVPKYTAAVYTFGGYATASHLQQEKQKFTMLLEKNGIDSTSSITLAQYNDPRTPPRMRTNELWIQI